ncbi:MAG TPA: septum formation initiator family protein [Bacteroidota bacterium]|nr:septum formation initiator family protein [Bacteroidota bacterium]
MDSNFYRNQSPEKLLKRIVRNAKKNKRRTVLLIIGFFLLLYMVFDNNGLLTRIKLEYQHRKWIEQLKADSLETKRLNEQMKALESNKDTVERLARERYGMTRKGETVYEIPPPQK